MDSLKIAPIFQEKSMTQDEILNYLMDNQTTYFENLLVIVGIVITVFLLIVTFSNVYIARELLRNDAKKLFRKEHEKFDKALEKKMVNIKKRSTLMMEHNTADFYITSIIPGKQFHALAHCFNALKIGIELNDIDEIFEILNFINKNIDLNIEEEYRNNNYAKRLKCKAKSDIYRIDEYKNILSQLPKSARFLAAEILENIVIDDSDECSMIEQQYV